MQNDHPPGQEQEPEVNYIDVQEALKIAAKHGIKTTVATMIQWLEKNKLGYQPGGINSKWFVDEIKFTEFIKGRLPHGKNRTGKS